MRRLGIFAAIIGGLWPYNGGYLDSILGTVAPEYVSAGAVDPVMEVASADTPMRAAGAQAQTTSPTFLNNAEVIWTSGFQQVSTNKFKEFLANQPNPMDGMNAGDEVTFTTDMVRDWPRPTADGQLFGNDTTRVMLAHLNEQGATMLARMLSPDPVPADWS
ncbi:MAG: DUF2314 domain-containing protein [Octadecabacter sp.]